MQMQCAGQLASLLGCAKHEVLPVEQQIVSMLWCRGAEGETAEALQQLLSDSIGQQQPEAVRMAALQASCEKYTERAVALRATALHRCRRRRVGLPWMVRQPVAVALSPLSIPGSSRPSLEPFFTRSVCSSPAPNAQWAIKLFPFGHIPARYLCILAAADPRFQISEAALEGLQPGKFTAAPGSFGSGSAGASASGSRGGGGKGGAAALPAYPRFEAVLRYLQLAKPQLGRRPAEGGELPLPPKALLAAIAFLESCRRAAGGSAAPGGGMSAEAATFYLVLLENALLPAAPSELHAAALAATLSVAAAHRAAFAAACAADPSRQAVLLRLSGHVDASARQAAAQLLGLLVAPGAAPSAQPAQPASPVHAVKQAASALGSMIFGSPEQKASAAAAALCNELLSTLRAGGPDGAKHAKQEALEGAAAAAGYVAANLLQSELGLAGGWGEAQSAALRNGSSVGAWLHVHHVVHGLFFGCLLRLAPL